MANVAERSPIRVFLVDDHEVVRVGLRELLEEQPDVVVVGEAETAAEAARRLTAVRPDVAILDARLPDGSGIDVCRQVRSVDPSIAALILTSYDDDEALLAAILAGAAGYVLKQIRAADLVAVVRQVAAGEPVLDPSASQRVRDRLRLASRGPEELRHLTRQERRVLDCIAEGLTNRQIGQRLSLAEKTVKNYVSSVLAKLGVERRTRAAVLASKLSST